jgi:CNT family concentrative nucleoside transporter
MAGVLQSALGFVVLLVLCWIASENRRAVPWRTVIGGVLLQIVVTWLLIRMPMFKQFAATLSDGLMALDRATGEGTKFVFGYLGGGDLPFAERGGASSFLFAFRVLPMIMVISALSSLLYYWRILPIVVRAISLILEKSLGVGGAVGVSTAANIFVGTVEAPLFVKPYLKELSRGELFMVMTAGMASVAGGVMAVYATVLRDAIPDAAGHIMVAAMVSAPAAILVCALLVPPEGAPTGGSMALERPARSSMDAITQGTLDGVQIVINIIAMLIVLIALVSLANAILGLLPEASGAPVTLQRIVGFVMAPFAWLIGVPWSEAQAAGAVLGTKTILNELIAYIDLAKLPPGTLSERSRIIMTYALCGFANLGSIGIMVGGMGTIIPERRHEIVGLAFKSMIAGTFATLVAGATVGMLLR